MKRKSAGYIWYSILLISPCKAGLQSFLKYFTFATSYMQAHKILIKQKMTALFKFIYPIFIMLYYKQPSFIQVSYILFFIDLGFLLAVRITGFLT